MSWGHAIRRATADEMHNTWREDRRRRCSHCDERGEYLVRYDYITGKQGRVSDARKLLCRDHAEKFCKRYRLELPIEEDA